MALNEPLFGAFVLRTTPMAKTSACQFWSGWDACAASAWARSRPMKHG